MKRIICICLGFVFTIFLLGYGIHYDQAIATKKHFKDLDTAFVTLKQEQVRDRCAVSRMLIAYGDAKQKFQKSRSRQMGTYHVFQRLGLNFMATHPDSMHLEYSKNTYVSLGVADKASYVGASIRRDTISKTDSFLAKFGETAEGL